MTYRADKSGLAAECQLKVEANYDPEEARKCLYWIKLLTGVDEIPDKAEDIDSSHDNFYTLLHDGLILCKLIDKLMPGKLNWKDKTFQVPKIEAMKFMRERERISIFTNFVQQYGVPSISLFPTESLHEEGALNLAQVCTCIRVLGVEAQTKPDYEGPEGYWPRKSEKNAREFTEEQLRSGRGVISLQYGSNKGASQAGMHIGRPRHIASDWVQSNHGPELDNMSSEQVQRDQTSVDMKHEEIQREQILHDKVSTELVEQD